MTTRETGVRSRGDDEAGSKVVRDDTDGVLKAKMAIPFPAEADASRVTVQSTLPVKPSCGQRLIHGNNTVGGLASETLRVCSTYAPGPAGAAAADDGKRSSS